MDRECLDCEVDISHMHWNARRCLPCRTAHNKMQHAKIQQVYYDRNTDAVKERGKKVYLRNKELKNAYMREWFRNHPGVQNQGAKDEREGTVLTLLERDGNMCRWCNTLIDEPYDGRETHIDHIIPRKVILDNRLENLQLLHRKCNIQKSATLDKEVGQ